MEQSFYHINRVLGIVKVLLGFLNMTVRVGDGNVIPTVDIDFLNFITTEILCKHRVLSHFGIELIR